MHLFGLIKRVDNKAQHRFRISRFYLLDRPPTPLWGAQAASLKRQSGIGLRLLAETTFVSL